MTTPHLSCPSCPNSLGLHEYHKGYCGNCKAIFTKEMYGQEGIIGYYDEPNWTLKTVKFDEEYVGPIDEGEKYVTLRFPPGHTHNVGDRISFEANTEDEEYNYIFGDGEIIASDTAMLEEIASLNTFNGHKSYDTWVSVYSDLDQYYNVPYASNVEVDVIVFSASCFGDSDLIDEFGDKRVSEPPSP